MKITFFIGNGYDINIGLKTAYPDFLKWYVQRSGNNDYIIEFKKIISEKLSYWSDLEMAIGQKTLTYPLNTKKGFKTCKQDLDTQLQYYLKTENKRISTPIQEDVDVFRRSIVTFPVHCDAGFRKDLQKVYDSHRDEEYEYNVVNFNFTNTVDVFWDALPYNAFWHTIFYPNLRTEEPQHFRIDDKKGKVYHIHGTLDHEMITGVGEPRQLVNTIYQTNEEIISVSVKPAINENCKNGIENRVSELIDSTDVFVIYGMSIGRTDVKWWKRVVQRLLTCENTYLLVVNYDKNYNKALPYTTSLIAMKIIANLIEVSECPLEHQDRIKGKIAVLLNTELFNYSSLIERQDSAALIK